MKAHVQYFCGPEEISLRCMSRRSMECLRCWLPAT